VKHLDDVVYTHSVEIRSHFSVCWFTGPPSSKSEAVTVIVTGMVRWLTVNSGADGRCSRQADYSLVSVHEGSPLGELHRCIREGVKVNVHIRTFKGLRGVCTGFLVAFDKFWNMVINLSCRRLSYIPEQPCNQNLQNNFSEELNSVYS
jgi:hypothetical protein